MDEQVSQYIEKMLPARNPFFLQLEQEAVENKVPIMDLTGIEVMLQYMRIQQPKRILEIGAAIGYSGLRMAEALPNCEIITIELDDDRYQQAVNNIQAFGREQQITVLKGNALELYDEVAKFGEYDAIFIDAAKGQYQKFFELYSPLLTENGCVYTDNVMFRGFVAYDDIENKRLRKLAEKINRYNEWMTSLKEFHTVIVPVGDGLAVSKKING